MTSNIITATKNVTKWTYNVIRTTENANIVTYNAIKEPRMYYIYLEIHLINTECH